MGVTPRVSESYPKARFGECFMESTPTWRRPSGFLTEHRKVFSDGQTEILGREPTRVGYVARTCLRACLLALILSWLSRRGAGTYPCAMR